VKATAANDASAMRPPPTSRLSHESDALAKPIAELGAQ